MEKQNSQLEHGQSMEQTRGLFCMCVSDVSLVAINKICVIHEAMNGCKNLKIHYMIASKI